jgi:hypothetical protein
MTTPDAPRALVSGGVTPRANPPACGGAAGQTKPGVGELLQLGTEAIVGTILVAADLPMAWLLAPIISHYAYNAVNICSRPQPPEPVLDITTINNAIQFKNPLVSFPAQQLVVQWFTNILWPLICNCANGSAPPLSTPSLLPPAYSNPGMPAGPQPTPCANNATSLSVPQQDWGDALIGITNHEMPASATSAHVKARIYPGGIGPAGTPGTVTVTWGVYGTGPTSTTYVQTFSTSATDTTMEANLPLIVNDYQIGYQIHADSWPSQFQADLYVDVYCNGDVATVPTEPCCPPDPLLDQKLFEIEQLLEAVWNQLQTLTGVKSWIDGVRHAGLSGNGSFPLQGKAIGIRVEMDQLPVGVQVNPGTPTFYYNAGFITPYSNDTPLRGWRLTYQDESYQLPSVTDMIGYTLLHGTTVDIVELLAPTS